MLIQCWYYIRSFTIIYLCLLAGNFLSQFFPIMVPGSILGMLILFILLALRIIPVDWVKAGCMILIRYMALLFVPIGVGIMNYYQPISQQITPILVSCLVSSLITMMIVGFCAHLTYK